MARADARQHRDGIQRSMTPATVQCTDKCVETFCAGRAQQAKFQLTLRTSLAHDAVGVDTRTNLKASQRHSIARITRAQKIEVGDAIEQRHEECVWSNRIAHKKRCHLVNIRPRGDDHNIEWLVQVLRRHYFQLAQ